MSLIDEICQHNKAIEAERKAYHERRCSESANYKRVYYNVTKMYSALRLHDSKVQQAVQDTKRIVEVRKLSDKDCTPLISNPDMKPERGTTLENFGFMIIAGFFGMMNDFALDLEHFEDDKPYYEEYFNAELEFNKRIVLPEQPDR